MDWHKHGSNGEENGADAAGGQQDQRAIALQALQRCNGSFVMICEDAEALRCVIAVYDRDVTDEEFSISSSAFLEAVSEAVATAINQLQEAA